MASNFRALKARWKLLILAGEWQKAQSEALALEGREAVGALISFLPQVPELKWHAVDILGAVIARLAVKDLERARIVMRQLMWQLNEESGNLGWGIPEALGSIMANTAPESLHWQSSVGVNFTAADKKQAGPIAQEYQRILHSYIRNTGAEDNFCEHGPMRKGAFWAVGRFCAAYPELAGQTFKSLVAGLKDEDWSCRALAVWALGKYVSLVSLEAEQRALLNDSLQALKIEMLKEPELASSKVDYLDSNNASPQNWNTLCETSLSELVALLQKH